MKMYRNRPVLVEAQIVKSGVTSATPILKWIKENGGTAVWCGAMPEHQNEDGRIKHPGLPESIRVKTPDGWIMAYAGYYIVQTSASCFYAFTKEDFLGMYEEDPNEQIAEVVKLPVRSRKRKVAN